MKTAILVILMNFNGGEQAEIRRTPPMPETACLTRMHNIWNQEWPQTDDGFNVIDAACLPEGTE